MVDVPCNILDQLLSPQRMTAVQINQTVNVKGLHTQYRNHRFEEMGLFVWLLMEILHYLQLKLYALFGSFLPPPTPHPKESA